MTESMWALYLKSKPNAKSPYMISILIIPRWKTIIPTKDSVMTDDTHAQLS